ncbi:MAG: hypothetical protein AAGD09_27340, partial [Cyanobacteria bacterium P01_F01_bin.56]
LASYEQRKIEAQIYKGFTLRLFMEFQAVGNVIALFQIFFFQNIPSRERLPGLASVIYLILIP